MDAKAYIQMKSKHFQCDLCGDMHPPVNRRYTITPRPSDPTELVCVMWTCPRCAPKAGGKTAEECEAYFQANRDKFTFLSI